MNIGLDYDDTITADVELWELFVHLAKSRGHDVRIVTFRFATPHNYVNDDVYAVSERFGIPIIFCNGVQKDEVTKSLDFPVDVWIDDFPVGIPLGEHLVGMAKGVRINDRPRTTLSVQIPKPTYSEQPLQIGNVDG